ncbi:hypothetical protein AeMF1_007807 [Aphanomyces euteiches]|nr:hypothetical protein AeMF1_007807 [Aphanomyces euteiches]
MNKVEALRQPSPSASFTRLSILYNVVFVLNLVTTPFTAYLGEPFPNSFGSRHLPTWTTFDEFVNETTTYFKQFYNNQTMLHETSLRDVQNNTFVLRRDMTLPYEISPSDIIDYMIRMPASLFFSYGTRAYITNFLTSNSTKRNEMKPWQMCQHNQLLTLTLSTSCVWLEEIDANRYTFWVTFALSAFPTIRWVKVIVRGLLTIYITYILWIRYYRHYSVLLSNLRQHGMAQNFVRYKIVIGDPAFSVLSDAVVSVAMVGDMFTSLPYVGLAHLQVTQFEDAWLYISGCMYLSRGVWYALLFMRIISI